MYVDCKLRGRRVKLSLSFGFWREGGTHVHQRLVPGLYKQHPEELNHSEQSTRFKIQAGIAETVGIRTVNGQNPAPDTGRWFIPLFIGFRPPLSLRSPLWFCVGVFVFSVEN